MPKKTQVWTSFAGLDFVMNVNLIEKSVLFLFCLDKKSYICHVILKNDKTYIKAFCFISSA